MSRYVLAAGTPELEAHLRAAVGAELETLPPGRLPTEPLRLFEQVTGADLPEVVVLGTTAAMHDVLALAGRLDTQWPGVSVVLVAEPSPDLWPQVMRAGIRDVVRPDAEPGTVRSVLEAAAHAALARRRALRPVSDLAAVNGRVITIASPKGGVGKTTVSTNLAVGLASVAPQQTVLVDLDVQFGDVASALGLVPEYTLPDAVHGPASVDTMVLKTFLTQHKTGLFAVCGSESPAAGDTVTAADVTQLLDSLAREFRYVVVDTAPGLSEHTLAALDRATDAVVLSSMDVPGVRGMRKELDVLTELDLLPAGRHVVMNFADTKGGLAVRDVETTIRTSIDVLLPRSAAVPPSTNRGVPLLESGERDAMTKQLKVLVNRFVSAPAVAPGKYRARHRAAS